MIYFVLFLLHKKMYRLLINKKVNKLDLITCNILFKIKFVHIVLSAFYGDSIIKKQFDMLNIQSLISKHFLLILKKNTNLIIFKKLIVIH